MDTLLDQPLIEVPVVVLDTETTGLDPLTGDRVVEIGAIRYEPTPAGKWQPQAMFDELIQPGRRMDPKASRINHIYDGDLFGKPTFSQVAAELMRLLSGALIIAHNASFDAGFLGLEFYIHNLDRSLGSGLVPGNPWLCTMQLARRQFRFGRNTLAHVARSLGVQVGNAHRALDDVRTTAEVAKRMARRLARRRITTVTDLLRAQGGPIYAPVMKHVSLPSPLDEALYKKIPLQILYDEYAGASRHLFDPLYATVSYGHKYLIGRSRNLGDQRTLRVDRILNAKLMNE